MEKRGNGWVIVALAALIVVSLIQEYRINLIQHEFSSFQGKVLQYMTVDVDRDETMTELVTKIVEHLEE